MNIKWAVIVAFRFKKSGRLKLHLSKSLQMLIFRIRKQQQNCAARSLQMERLPVSDVSVCSPQGTNCPFPFYFMVNCLSLSGK